MAQAGTRGPRPVEPLTFSLWEQGRAWPGATE